MVVAVTRDGTYEANPKSDHHMMGIYLGSLLDGKCQLTTQRSDLHVAFAFMGRAGTLYLRRDNSWQFHNIYIKDYRHL